MTYEKGGRADKLENRYEYNSAEFVDYTGKLNSHADYLNVIKLLKQKSKYMEYVLVDEDDTRIIDRFKDFVRSIQHKNEWWGTKSSKRSKVYRLMVSKELFQYLQKFETFCKYTVSDYEDVVENTDFGMNDIAFFDNKNLPLLFTTTHEGYITVQNDLFL